MANGLLAQPQITVTEKAQAHKRRKPHGRDGMAVAAGTKLMTIAGNARAILSAERTALNFLQRMSGVASLTRLYADRVRGTRANTR